MKALLRKEWIQVRLAVWVVGVLVFLKSLSAGSKQQMFIVPVPGEQLPVWMLAGLLGAGIGYYQLAAEERGGSCAYLWHRGISVGRVLLAKALAAWGVLACALLLPGVLAYLALHVVPELRPILQPRRVLELAVLCSVGLATHAFGALHATLPVTRSIQLVALFGSLLGIAMMALVPLLADWGEPDLRLGILVAGHLAIAILVLGVVRGRALQGRDPASRTGLAGGGGSAALLSISLGAFLWLSLGVLGSQFHRWLFSQYSRVWTTFDGRVELVERSDGAWKVVGTGEVLQWASGARWKDGDLRTRGAPVLSLNRNLDLSDDLPRFWPYRAQDWHAGEAWTGLRSYRGSVHHNVFFDRTSHQLHLFREAWPSSVYGALESELGRHVVVDGAFGDPVEITGKQPRRTICFLDRTDGRLWCADLGSMQVRPAPLPAGQRFERVERVLVKSTALVGVRAESNFGPLVVGQQDAYVWTDEGWQAFQPEDEPRGLRESEFEAASRFECSVDDWNSPTPRVSFRSRETGALAFDHRFEPREAWATVHLVAERALRSLRSPLVATVSYSSNYRDAQALDYLFAEPELFGGRRRDVLMLAWLVACGLAALAERRARRAGLSRGERVAWAVVVLASGLAGLGVQLVLVRGRARRPAACMRTEADEGVRRLLAPVGS